MSAFFEGVVAGYGIAIPVGAVAILIVETGLREGFATGFMAGAGAATADLIYATIAVVAGVAVAAVLAPFAGGLKIVSVIVLFALGSYGIWRAFSRRNQQGQGLGNTTRHGRIRTYWRLFRRPHSQPRRHGKRYHGRPVGLHSWSCPGFALLAEFAGRDRRAGQAGPDSPLSTLRLAAR